MTNPDIHQAKQWAKEAYEQKSNGVIIDGIALAAARVIQSLPDRRVDAEKLQKVIDDLHPELKGGGIEQALRHLLTSLPLQTLAELIDRGNDPSQYQWMQAEAVDTDKRFGSHGVITAVNPPWLASRRCMFLTWCGDSMELPWDEVIPAVDEPKLELPSLFLSGESEDVSLETETNTEGGAPGVYDDGGPLLPGSQRINLVGARKLPPLADTIPDQVVAKDACNNTVPQSGDVWRAVWLDRAGILVVGKGIHHESGSLQGYFFMDHDPQVRWVGTDEVDLTKLVLRRGQ